MKRIKKVIFLSFLLLISFFINSQNNFLKENVIRNIDRNSNQNLPSIVNDENSIIQPLALVQGESFTVKVVKVVNGAIVDSKTLTSRCLQSTGHSGFNHSTNLRNLANQSGFSGYKGYNWSKYTTVPSSYTTGLAPNNNYASIHYNITGSPPYKGDETLFLFFEASHTFQLKYDANGGSGAPDSQTATSTTSSYNFIISDKEPTRNGYEFKGWSTSSTSPSPNYHVGETINVTGSTTLYAVWERVTEKVTLTYMDGKEIVGNVEEYEKGSIVKVKYNDNNHGQAYIFRGWDTDPSAQNVVYKPNAEFTITENTILYAVWYFAPDLVTLDYNPNGGKDEPGLQTESYNGDSVTFSISRKVPNKTGFKFQGWTNNQKDLETPTHQPGGKITTDNDIILYAVWEERLETDYDYKVEWYDIEGNLIQEIETRTAPLGEKIYVKEDDKKIDGYIFAEDFDKNILTDTLKEQDTVLRLYFYKVEEITENPTTSDKIIPISIIVISLILLIIYLSKHKFVSKYYSNN